MKEIEGKNAKYFINGGELTVVPLCDIDHHNCIMLKSEADRIIENNNIKNIVFDFENVGFMDSSGIGVIIGRYKKISYMGGGIIFQKASPAVDRILKMSGLYKLQKNTK